MEQNNLSISIMNMEDLENIKNILENDFDDFWNYHIFKSELKNPNSTYFIAKINNEIIGFVGVLIVIDEADITNIVVKKSFRGQHFSKKLLAFLIDYCDEKKCKKINLEVNSNNIIAIKLYKSFGFRQVGLRKNYYKDGDALLLAFFI